MTQAHRRADHYTQRARREGRPARSVYKLEEINQRWQLFRRGAAVLDLGAAPGSWAQYAAEQVGPHGRVWAVDLQPLRVALPAWAEFLIADAFALDVGDRRFDVVLSDMAPATMGDHRTDATRSVLLAERAAQLAAKVLRTGGHLVVKVLEGGDLPALVKQLRGDFEKIERLRPQATRSRSTEIFVIGLRRRAVAHQTTCGNDAAGLANK